MKSKLGREIIIGLVCVAMSVVVTGCGSKNTQTTPYNNLHPIEVMAVMGPLQPINPGGPLVEITLKNVAAEPVTAVTANLQLNSSAPNNGTFPFTFDVSTAKPLLSGKTVSTKKTLIGGGFSDSQTYPLAISGTTQVGYTFSYTEQVIIVAPAGQSSR
jgi:hypothetical protein